jgi:hypothetical protein
MLRVYDRLVGAGAYKKSDSLYELLVSIVYLLARLYAKMNDGRK